MNEAQEIRLSKKTIGFLKNFSEINKSIVIKALDKTLATMAVNKNILAFSSCSEEFPEDIPIYDLPLFVKTCSMFEQPHLVFLGKNKVYIADKATKGKATYMKSDPDIIVQPPKTYDPNLPEKVVNFELTMKNLKLLREAAYNFGVTDFCVNSFQGELSISVRDKKTESSHVFSVPVDKVIWEEDFWGTTPTHERNFCYCLKMENLKILDGTYHVCISDKNVINFNSLSESSLNYFIALEPNQD